MADLLPTCDREHAITGIVREVGTAARRPAIYDPNSEITQTSEATYGLRNRATPSTSSVLSTSTPRSLSTLHPIVKSGAAQKRTGLPSVCTCPTMLRSFAL